MATIQAIDIIKGISGKYGNKSNDYFATNKSSNKIHIAKLANPYKGPATEKQKVQREKFAKQQAASSAWLNANRPNEKNGSKGTPAYQFALKLKRTFAFSNINQVLFKYMDKEFNIKLPDSIDAPKTDNEGSGSTTNPGSGDTGSEQKPGGDQGTEQPGGGGDQGTEQPGGGGLEA